MPDPKDLVNLQGRPLFKVPNLIVIKIPKGTRLPEQMIMGLSKVTGCAIVELPLSCELMMGEMAQKEMDSMHHAIHAISELPDINFNNKEITILYSAMRYMCEKTNPGEHSAEVILLRSIKKFAV